MIVIVAGMQRSGSTFSYNVARELLNGRGGTSTFATSNLAAALSEPCTQRHSILKTHEPDELTNNLLKKDGLPCICTIRKPEDAIVSWMHVFGFSIEDSVATYRQWLIWHQSMHPHMLNLRYEEIDKLPILAIKKISTYLAGTWKLSETIKIWLALRKKVVYARTKNMKKMEGRTTDIGFSHYDNKTFFHRNHVTSLESRQAKDHLSAAQINFIRNELCEFLDKNGNYHW